jgi:hypothetical protein
MLGGCMTDEGDKICRGHDGVGEGEKIVSMGKKVLEPVFGVCAAIS